MTCGVITDIWFNVQAVATALNRVLKPGGVVVWIVGDQTIDGSETVTSFKHTEAFKEAGFCLHDTMIYDKYGILIDIPFATTPALSTCSCSRGASPNGEPDP